MNPHGRLPPADLRNSLVSDLNAGLGVNLDADANFAATANTVTRSSITNGGHNI